MSKVLALHILNVAAAHEAAYDREASDKATEDARVRAREELRKSDDAARPKVAPVTLREIRKRIVKIKAVPHTVEVCFKGGNFVTNKGFRGNIENVRRLGRGYVYVTEEYTAEQQEQRVEQVMDFIDYAQFQRKTLWQCVEENVPHLYQQPVYLMLQCAWNDALGWANTVNAQRDPVYGEDSLNFRFVIQNDGNGIDYQVPAADELSAAFKLGQIFNEDLSLEKVKLIAG